MNALRRVALAGTGLIGASIGLAARAAGFAVTGWDPDPAALEAAREIGALDHAAASFAELVAELEPSDVLVLAGPLPATLAEIGRPTLDAVPAGLILDVASTKRAVSAAAGGRANFVGSHPIAGSEQSGARFARADLFAGKTWTLDAAAPQAARNAAAAFVGALGARPLVIAAAEHDAILALTSHMPQVLAVALAERLADRLDDPNVALLCGTGMRSMTRLGASAWSMWQGVLADNFDGITQELRNFAVIVGAVADEIEAGRWADVERRFKRSASAVSSLEGDAPAPSMKAEDPL